jgi:zinc D-Ala-D-Ala carboxypeptidase
MRYFEIDEFDSPDLPGSGEEMKQPFLTKLDIARGEAGIPFRINSGYRTPAHNRKVGGVEGSSHLKGCAADIHCNTSSDRHKIVCALISVGFNRIGIGKTFVHVDDDKQKQNELMWLY